LQEARHGTGAQPADPFPPVRSAGLRTRPGRFSCASARSSSFGPAPWSWWRPT